jgi:F-box and leucine-rich repeat protein GRR1
MSSASSSSSSSTSPERGADDDNDSFMLQANDSQSSLGLDMSPEMSQTEAMRLEYEERCRVSPVHRLPAELLISIFSRLTSPRDLQMCMLVCKEWAKNSVGLLWHRPQMSKWESIHSVVSSIRKGNKFFAYQDLVKRLNMSTLAGQVSDGTLTGMVDCKRIERLTLTNCCKLTDLSLQPLIDGNRSLLALDVTGLDQLTDRTMMTVADNCLRLQGLNITGCKKLTDASIMAIARNCRHLKRLKFNNCLQLTDLSILTIAAHSSHLLEIDLYGLQNMESPSVTSLLLQCPHLREMRLAHCSRIGDSAFLDIPSDPELPTTFDSLRILDLTDCGELGDKGVEKIIESCPRLRNLILAKCRQITDRAVHAITRLGKNLHYIHLGHCARITDHSVMALARACNRIRYIDLACCSNLTDDSVMKLAGLPKLKRIGLVKCAGITDRSIYSLAIGEVKNGRKVNGTSVLERVHLSYCTLLTLDVSITIHSPAHAPTNPLNREFTSCSITAPNSHISA